MRRTKLTKERKARILHEIENGSTKEMAALISGISEQTLYNWINKGREEEPPEDLERLNKKQLQERAKEHRIPKFAKMKKAELIDAIIEEESKYYHFYQEMQQAEARGQQYHIQNIRRAALEDWKASAWFLERRDPANWAKRDRLHVENQHSGSIETKQKQETKIEIIQRLESDPELQEHYLAIWERERALIE